MDHLYLSVLRTRHARPLLAAALLGRLSFAMGPLTLVLFVQQRTHSFAAAGVATAAIGLASGLFAPLRGRLIDRSGQRLLLPFAALYAASLLAMLPLVRAGSAGLVAAVTLAGAAGAMAPPLSASMRVLWASLVGRGPRLQTAYALDAVLEEVIYTAGPLLAAALTTLTPAAALAVAASFSLIGTAAFTASPVARSWVGGQQRVPGWAGAMRGGGIRALIASLSGFGAATGILTIALVAAARRDGSAELGGVLLAVVAGSSAVGGLWYGGRTWRRPTAVRYTALLGLAALACAAMPFFPAVLQLGVVVAAFGLLLAPLQSSAYLLAAELAPHGTMTEAATWVTTANNVTGAAGTALAGALVDSAGVPWTLGAAFFCAAAAFLVALASRQALRPPSPLQGEATVALE